LTLAFDINFILGTVRDQNAAEKFWIGIHESQKLWNSSKVGEING